MRVDLAGMLLRLVTGVAVRTDLPPPTGAPRIFFANHTSNLDFLVIWSALPSGIRRHTRPAAAKDYWSRGVIRPLLARNLFRAVLIERKKVTVGSNPLSQLAAAIEAGDSILIFPEGTRSLSGKVRVFKSGLYHLARRFPDVELVPVYLDNLSRILPKGEFLPVPLLCSASFGPPMALNPGEAKEAFLARARENLLALREARDD